MLSHNMLWWSNYGQTWVDLSEGVCFFKLYILGWVKLGLKCRNKKKNNKNQLLGPIMACLEKKKIDSSLKPGWARAIPTTRGGSLVSGGPLGVFFAWKLKIYVKIIYFEHFVLLGKFWLLMIFGTLLSKKCPFLGNFDPNQFLPH